MEARRLAVGVGSVLCVGVALLSCGTALFAVGRVPLRLDMLLWSVVALSAGVTGALARNWVVRTASVAVVILAGYLVYGRTVVLGEGIEGESYFTVEVYLAPLLVLIAGVMAGLALLLERVPRSPRSE